jgi:hypothetical protein
MRRQMMGDTDPVILDSVPVISVTLSKPCMRRTLFRHSTIASLSAPRTKEARRRCLVLSQRFASSAWQTKSSGFS